MNQTDPLDEILEGLKPERESIDTSGMPTNGVVGFNLAIDKLEANLDEAKAAINAEIAKARIEGVEMLHNALFYDASSNNGVIELDTGETHIRYNNLIKELEATP